MKKMFLASLTLVVLTAGVITFIYYSNDHSACETTTEITYGDNREKITTKTHICKEKYNL